jgi:hypothetical protein
VYIGLTKKEFELWKQDPFVLDQIIHEYRQISAIWMFFRASRKDGYIVTRIDKESAEKCAKYGEGNITSTMWTSGPCELRPFIPDEKQECWPKNTGKELYSIMAEEVNSVYDWLESIGPNEIIFNGLKSMFPGGFERCDLSNNEAYDQSADRRDYRET